MFYYFADRCSEMCWFTGSAIVVQRHWSKLGLNTLLKGTSAHFSHCWVGYSNQRLFGYYHTALTARLPAALLFDTTSVLVAFTTFLSHIIYWFPPAYGCGLHCLDIGILAIKQINGIIPLKLAGYQTNKHTVQINSSNSLFYTISYRSTGKPWLTNSLTKMAALNAIIRRFMTILVL